VVAIKTMSLSNSLSAYQHSLIDYRANCAKVRSIETGETRQLGRHTTIVKQWNMIYGLWLV